MPIVAATGAAQAATQNGTRPGFAAEMQTAVTNAIKQAALDGVVSHEEIKARISSARSVVKSRYTDQ